MEKNYAKRRTASFSNEPDFGDFTIQNHFLKPQKAIR